MTEALSVAAGERSPDFQLKTQTGDDWRLSEHLGNVVALLFYPKDETLVCTKQMCSLRDHWSDYLDTKALIVGVSPGTVEEHSKFSERHRLPITLLADTDRAVTENFGFHWFFPTFLMRSVVIIDAKGFIRSRKVMLRAFRPSDRSVIASIYEARADLMSDKYEDLKSRVRNISKDSE